MTGSNPADEEKARQARLFKELFGVSEAELRGRDVDPGDYARQNIGKALKDKSKASMVLSRSAISRRCYLKWGLRVFIGCFVGYALLITSTIRPLSSIHDAIVGACIAVFMATVLMLAVSARYYVVYLRSCRQEGIKAVGRRRGKVR